MQNKWETIVWTVVASVGMGFTAAAIDGDMAHPIVWIWRVSILLVVLSLALNQKR